MGGMLVGLGGVRDHFVRIFLFQEDVKICTFFKSAICALVDSSSASRLVTLSFASSAAASISPQLSALGQACTLGHIQHDNLLSVMKGLACKVDTPFWMFSSASSGAAW